jgi:hypothetical protein
LNWDTLLPDSSIEMGFLRVDIVSRNKFVESNKTIHRAKAIFRGLVEGIVASRGGKILSWSGEGGSFMFITPDGEGLGDLVFSGFQILHSLPIINDEIATKSRFSETFSVRMSADTGFVVYDHSGQISGDAFTRFTNSKSELEIAGTFSITGRIWRQLEKSIKTRFLLWKRSHAAQDDIYNHGIREEQLQILSSLKNINLESMEERPYAWPECVEIIAIKGDRLADLARYAYRDVILEGYSNIGGLNLMIIKNAQVCGSSSVDLLDELKGGETLRFYNCTALGFAPEIGLDTLVDNVIAGHLNISRATGGVEEPVLKQRLFKLVGGHYKEINDEQ